MNTFGRWLRRSREATGITQKDFARRAKLSQSYLNDIELGRRIPPTDTVRQITAIGMIGGVEELVAAEISAFVERGEICPRCHLGERP